MKSLARWTVLVLVAGVLAVWHASLAFAGCTGRMGLGSQEVVCFGSGSELEAHMDSAEGLLWEYDWRPQCANGGICHDLGSCEFPDGSKGTLYDVFRRRMSEPKSGFELFATVCLAPGEDERLRVITWLKVWRAMKTLEWPQADLNIQPPDGKTLVNFKTNFYTTTTQEQIQPVTLLGEGIEIKATPVEYTWHWRDGSDPEQTANPGAEFEEGRELEVYHEYLDAHVVVHPSVDVTYQGHYRVVGDPDWIPIPETLTVTGDPGRLRIIEAVVHLIG